MARPWESIICYEDRSDAFHTTRWRLSGIATKEDAQNTDDGVLWLAMSKSGDTVTATLYKDEARTSSVATGTADVSDCDNTGDNAAQVTLTAENDSGITGTFWIHEYRADGNCPLVVALCTDEDMDSRADGVESLTAYDSTNGCAECVRLATEEVIATVAKIYADEFGGVPTEAAWFITDAERTYPDLRMIANPSQLRLATMWKSLEIAYGRSHQRASDTMYSAMRDDAREQYSNAIGSLVLAIKTGDGEDTVDSASSVVVRQVRV